MPIKRINWFKRRKNIPLIKLITNRVTIINQYYVDIRNPFIYAD